VTVVEMDGEIDMDNMEEQLKEIPRRPKPGGMVGGILGGILQPGELGD
jgi:hypothetical protein